MASPEQPERLRLACSLSSSVPLLLPALGAIGGVVIDRLVWPLETGVWMTLVLVVSWLSLFRRLRATGLLLTFVMLGGMWHHARYWDLGEGEFGRPTRWPAWVRGTIADDAVFRPGGDWPGHPGFTRTVIEICSRRHTEAWKPSTGRLLVTIPGDRSDLNLGDPVEAAGMLSAIDGPLNPGEADARDYWRSQGVWSRLQVELPEGVWPCTTGEVPESPWLKALGRARRWSRDQLTGALDPEVAPIASALLLGRREAIDPDLNDAFARTGTTHLLAISGLHLQALALFLWWIFRVAGRSRQTGLIGVTLVSIGYAALVGFAPSVVRSLVMTVLACLSGLRNREIRPPQVFSGAALVTILFNPSNVFDVGCQLSFLAVAAIVWGVPPVLTSIRHRLGANDPLAVMIQTYQPAWLRLLKHAGWWGLEGVVVSTVVWLAAWPLVAWRFHVSSPLGVLLNIPLIPLTTFALFTAGSTLLLASAWLPLSVPSAWLTARFLNGTASLVLWGAGQRWGSFFVAGPPQWWVVGFYGMLGLIWWASQEEWEGQVWLRCVMAGWCALGLVGEPQPKETTVRFLAVGHGLAVVVQSGSRAVLYDGGRMGESSVGRRIIAPALWACGVRRLDAVFLSHSDSDHFNGIPDLLDRIPADVLYLPSDFARANDPAAAEMLQAVAERRVPVRSFDAGQSITLGESTRLTAIHPPKHWKAGAKDNERSLVLDVDVSGHHVLLTGDLEGVGLNRVLAQPVPAFRYEVVLSPHHGARVANPTALFEWTRPALVVASQKPPIGLPPGGEKRKSIASDNDIKDSLSDAVTDRATLYRTWRRGEIEARWNQDRLLVTSFAEPDDLPKTTRTGIHPLNLYAILHLFSAWQPWVVTLVGLGVGLGLAFLIFVIEWGAGALVHPRRHRLLVEPVTGPGELVEIKAGDGARLVGTWYPSPEPDARTLLMLHGLGEDRSSLRTRAETFHARGWNVAILDGRGFGESGGETVAFGGHEAEDLGRWIDGLSSKIGQGRKVAVWGRSMGAAIAIRTARGDNRIGALILEAPYADLHITLMSVLRRYRLPATGFLSRLILGKAHRIARAPLHLPRPIDFAQEVTIPTLILRGVEDRLVPLSEADRLAQSFPTPVQRIEVPEAGHANVFGVGGESLVEQLAGFLDASIPLQESNRD